MRGLVMPGVGLLSFAEPGLLVSRAKAYGHYPPGAVLVCGLAGIPLWLRSYACVPFRLAERETDAEWGLVVASGVGAMVAGSGCGIAGLITWRASARDSAESPKRRVSDRLCKRH